MMEHLLTKDSPKSRDSEPPVTTLAGLKKEASTAVIHYFAPVVAIYNELAATAGLPIVKWRERVETGDKTKPRP
jgi:hypothetical protein